MPNIIGYTVGEIYKVGGKGRTRSYSSYGGNYDTLAINAFGQFCQHKHARQLHVWKTLEGATKALCGNEIVIPLGPTNDELRHAVRLASFDDENLRRFTQLIEPPAAMTYDEMIEETFLRR